VKQAQKNTSEDQSREVQSTQLAQDVPELLSGFAFFRMTKNQFCNPKCNAFPSWQKQRN